MQKIHNLDQNFALFITPKVPFSPILYAWNALFKVHNKGERSTFRTHLRQALLKSPMHMQKVNNLVQNIALGLLRSSFTQYCKHEMYKRRC